MDTDDIFGLSVDFRNVSKFGQAGIRLSRENLFPKAAVVEVNTAIRNSELWCMVAIRTKPRMRKSKQSKVFLGLD
jgi:hypothetical protein